MAEALALKFGLSLAQRTGCNRIIINSDNMEVIETMNEGGRSSGAAAAIFDDCFHLACDFLFLDSSIVIEKQIKLLMNLPSWLDWFEEPHNASVPILINNVMIISNE